jgi:hypothetical protein
MLQWTESEVTYLLGVEPTRDESGDPYFAYRWSQDCLTVELTVFDASASVYLSLTQPDAQYPLIDLQIEPCPGITYRREFGQEWLEFDPPSKSAEKSCTATNSINTGLRLFVKPNLAVRLIPNP